MIYLDNAATTPVRPEVIEAMLPYFNQFYGNPSNLYSLALRSRRALDEARATVAKAIGARGPEEIVFTGCGTEADNLAVLGLARARQNLGRHIITSTIEHHAVLYACEELRREGVLTRVRGLLYLSDGWGEFPGQAPDYPAAFLLPRSGSYLELPDDFPGWATRVILDPNDFTIQEASQ